MPNRLIHQRYELLRVLRKSDIAKLHYGWDHLGQRPVAIEEVRTSHVTPPGMVDAFISDAASLRTIIDPHLIHVFDIRQDAAGHLYVITEYLDGITVDKLLVRLEEQQKRLPPPLALSITRHTLQAISRLQAAHTAGKRRSGTVAVHPSRIALIGGGEAKFIPYGLPRSQEERAEDTVYLSPEEARGKSADYRSAFYALGVILFELLTGQSPYQGSSDERLSQIANADIDERALSRAGIPRRVLSVVHGLLEADPGARYSNPEDILSEINATETSEAEGSGASALADLADALQTPDETKLQRQLRLTRGGDRSQAQLHETAPVDPDTRFADQMPAPGQFDTVHSTEPREDSIVDEPTAGQSPRRTPANRARRLALIALVIALCVIAYCLAGWQWGFGPLARHPGKSTTPDAVVAPGEVASIPPGAEVHVDGQWTGYTPCSLGEMRPGPVRLRLEVPGLLPIDTVLEIPEEIASLQLPPFVFACRVHFNSVPPGARVIIDGHELNDLETSRFSMAVTETVEVAMTLGLEDPTSIARLNPMAGLVPPSDSLVWHWRAPDAEGPAELVGLFSRIIEIRSQPSGAAVFVDSDSLPLGRTALSLQMTYGEHTIRLRREPYLEYRFVLRVGPESQAVYEPVLRRTVLLSAVSNSDTGRDVGADIAWLRQGSAYIVWPFDELKTPYSIPLIGYGHVVRFRHRLFADTTVRIGTDNAETTVALRPAHADGHQRWPEDDDNDEKTRWVLFHVRGPEGAIAEAEVIGVEKNTGVSVRYAPTDGVGALKARVPIGDYDWWARIAGSKGRADSKRIRGGRDYKEITLRVDER